MRIHHLNCGTLCPLGGARLVGHPHMVCHCLLIEFPQGLILADTGFGLDDIQNPARRLGHLISKGFHTPRDPSESAIRQVQALGFKPSDVRHIVLTHLDFDHAGGISDFPQAQVHVFETELEAAMSERSLMRVTPIFIATRWRPSHAVRSGSNHFRSSCKLTASSGAKTRRACGSSKPRAQAT